MLIELQRMPDWASKKAASVDAIPFLPPPLLPSSVLARKSPPPAEPTESSRALVKVCPSLAIRCIAELMFSRVIAHGVV